VIDHTHQPALRSWVSCGVGAGLAFEDDGAAVRHDEPGPDQKHARLTERDLAVVDADQSRSLRYEWNIDLSGNPTNPLWPQRQFLSIGDECRPKATREDDRARMEELGIKPVATTVYDYGGRFANDRSSE
jgi:hypothetical protein